MIDVVIVGAGGFGQEVFQYARDALAPDEYRLKGFLDDDGSALKGRPTSIPLLGAIDAYSPASSERFVIAVGSPDVRAALCDNLSARGAEFLTIKHPLAYVSTSAIVRDGCVLCPFTYVGPQADLGPHVVLNTHASVGHDSVVGKCCVLSPYAVVNAGVRLGSHVFMGTHATVVPSKTIGTGSKLAAGSVATRDVPPHALLLGNPGRARVMFRSGTGEADR